MKPIEEVYEGLGRKVLNDMEYILCPAQAKIDTCTEDYINGKVSTSGLNISSFRLPALKFGTHSNCDGYYPLDQLICHNENGKLQIDRAERLGDETTGVFFDVKKERIIVECGNVLEAISRPDEFIVGHVSKRVYCTAVLWNFFVSEENTGTKN